MSPQPFKQEHLEALKALGSERSYASGETITGVGERMDSFQLVLDGEVEVVNPFTGVRMVPSTLRAGQFLGELNFLSGGSATLPMRAAELTTLLEVPRAAMLELMSRIPEVGDHVLTVFSARRRLQVEEKRSALTVIGADRDPAVQRVASFLSRNRIPFQQFDLDEKNEDVAPICAVAQHRPSVILGTDTRLDDPTPRKVAALLGLDLEISQEQDLDLLIVGGGPAGVAAAVYAGSEGLCALVVEDTAIGGQAGTSSRIENFMGFPTGISGADLTYRGQVQAMKFGTRFVMPRRVTALNHDPRGFCVTLDDGEKLCARSVLVATGVQYRGLPVERLEEFEGAGVYYAATEMEARFCRQTEAVVIGGGNSAGQAAMFLSRAARHVHLLVRRHELASTMSHYLRDRLEADPTITIHYGSQLAEVHGDDHLRAVVIKTPDGNKRLDASALFIMIGAAPNTDWLSGMVDLDSKGYVLTGADVGARSAYETSQPGIFAVGDVRSGSTKRVASSVGEGSVVVSAIWSHIDAQRAEPAPPPERIVA
ncbi:FAD-dependent oxidoreductase [Sphingomonas piscis]